MYYGCMHTVKQVSCSYPLLGISYFATLSTSTIIMKDVGMCGGQKITETSLGRENDVNYCDHVSDHSYILCPKSETYTVEPPIKDPPRKGQPPYKGHSSRSLCHSINTFLTSEKRTTSEIRTEAVSPKCPLLGGSTV